MRNRSQHSTSRNQRETADAAVRPAHWTHLLLSFAGALEDQAACGAVLYPRGGPAEPSRVEEEARQAKARDAVQRAAKILVDAASEWPEWSQCRTADQLLFDELSRTEEQLAAAAMAPQLLPDLAIQDATRAVAPIRTRIDSFYADCERLFQDPDIFPTRWREALELARKMDRAWQRAAAN